MGLTGPSGAGKSLLLRAIADLDPHEGMVRLDGTEATRFKPGEWRKKVGLLPAESQWWYDTVGEHFRNTSPEKFAQLGFPPEVIHWQVSRLSSGEKQRLALLRLLENRPLVLLLDEPTANLDRKHTARVEAVIKSYQHDTRAPILWVGHDPEQLERVADRVLEIRDRKIREIGR